MNGARAREEKPLPACGGSGSGPSSGPTAGTKMPAANAAATHLVRSPSVGRPSLAALPPMRTTAAMSRLMTATSAMSRLTTTTAAAAPRPARAVTGPNSRARRRVCLLCPGAIARCGDKNGPCWASVAVDTHEAWQVAAVGGDTWKEAELDYWCRSITDTDVSK